MVSGLVILFFQQQKITEYSSIFTVGLFHNNKSSRYFGTIDH